MSYTLKKCKHCRIEYVGHSNAKFCSVKCRNKVRGIKRDKKLKQSGIWTEENAIEWCECAICEYRNKELGSHLKHFHQISAKEYRQQFPDKHTKSQKLRESLLGNKNPAYQHGGKFSAFSDKFIHYTPESKNNAIAASRKTKSENPQNSSTNIEYYIQKGLSLEDAAIALSKRQHTFSLEKCIDRYGEEKGKARWQKRQESWLKNYKKNNFSKSSQKLFQEVVKHIPPSSNIFFATYDRGDMTKYHNKEFRLSLSAGKVVQPDFIEIDSKKIIEFDGDYWHSNTTANPIREKQRDQAIREDGFDILHIKERDFKQDANNVIQQCLAFLNK